MPHSSALIDRYYKLEFASSESRISEANAVGGTRVVVSDIHFRTWTCFIGDQPRYVCVGELSAKNPIHTSKSVCPEQKCEVA